MKASPNTLSKLVTSKLIGRIIEGTYPSGTRLPTEREIAEEFQVTRNVVREALKRLEALGLVTIRRGSGIYVEDLKITGGVELLEVLIFREDGSMDLGMLRDVIEFFEDAIRSVIRHAAERAREEELERLRVLVEERGGRVKSGGDVEDVSREIVTLIVDATHNSFYRLLYNTMLKIPVLTTGFFSVVTSPSPKVQTFFERLVEAFQAGDVEMAELLTIRVFEAYEEEAAGILMERVAKHLGYG